ncbi:transglutaminaseTgpA domain-containing protein [Egicoccus sp. AB-alg2]|uniref:transglutaminaseTgpA domain-containing protein n=1 Tax=Egicoccus sp. AB-alg2 TaxID=3242693 RepID=UPI00359F0FB8
MRRRDGILAVVTLLVVLATLPAYGRVFGDPAWRGPVIVAALLALVTAAALRALRVPWWVALVVSAGALAMLTYVLHLPPDGLLPGTEQWQQARELFAEALVEIRETPSPAPVLPGLLLLLTTGFWAVTHLAHEVVVRWRRAGLGLVPVLVLWAVPLAITAGDGPTWRVAVPFLAGAGLLLLLSAPDALPAGQRPVPRATTSGLAVGTAAIVVAVVAPGVLPGYDAEAWIDLGSAADPRGYQPIVDVSDRLKLPTERDVLRVRTEQRTYLRLAGLDSFDGFTWRLGPTGEGSYRPDPSSLFSARDVLPPEADASASEPLFVDVEVLELQNIYVPVPYQPVQVLGPQRDEMVWSTEGGFLATWDTVDGELAGQPRVGVREGVTYRVQASRPTPSYEQLREVEIDDATRERLTQLPREYEGLREQAEEVYAAADADTTVDRALALQEWFIGDEGGFTYDLDVPALRGDRALERFVLEDKVGYCEYFATAMAVMLRETGIPARVAVGFLPGRLSAPADPALGREMDEYTVSTRDAHAWVEVLFPGYGWVTFEPTPRDDRTQIVPREADLTPLENERERAARLRAEEREEQGPDARDNTTPNVPLPLPNEDTAPPQATSPEAGTQAGRTAIWPLALIGLGLLGVALVTVRSQRGRARSAGDGPAGRVLMSQRRLLAGAASLGLVRRPSETTPELVARWQAEGRVDGAGTRFAQLAQRAAFGGDVDDRLADEAEVLATELEEDLRASVDTRDRLLSPVRVPVTQGVSRTRELVGAVRDRWRG